MLMSKKKPRPFMLAQYYDSLQKIFWKSENYLFHAFAMLKYYLLCKQNRKNFPKAEEEQMASELLLASLIVLYDQKNTRLLDSDSLELEKQKRLARLLGSGAVPTRASLSAEIQSKRIYENACEPAQRFYDMLLGDCTPIELGEKIRPCIESIVDWSEGKLAHYQATLRTCVCLRVLFKLSELYSTMTMKSYKKAMDILPWIEVEKVTAEASKSGLVQLKFNYADQTIAFKTEDTTMTIMRKSLISIAENVLTFEETFFAGEVKEEEAQARKKLHHSLKERLEEEEGEIIHRRHVIEDRKQVREKEEQQAEEELRVKMQADAEREEEESRKRQEEEAKRRAHEREEKAAKEKEAERTKAYLDSIKDKVGKSAQNIKVGDKTLKDIEFEDLNKIDMSELETAREGALRKEREALIRNRKAEFKRVDHTARALREEEVELLNEWKVTIQESMEKSLKDMKTKKFAEEKKKYELAQENKQFLDPYIARRSRWFEEQMQERYAEHAGLVEKEKSRRKAQIDKLIQQKVDRARQRQRDFEEEEIKREREEEEREQRALEAEKKKQEQEERDRVEERKRKKEEEIREREAEERNQRREQRDPGPDIRGGKGDDRGPPRRGPDRDDDDDPRFSKFGGRDDRDDRDGPRRRDDDDGDTRFSNLRGGRDDDRGGYQPRFGKGKGDRDDRGPRGDDRGPRRNDDEEDSRFSNLRGGKGRDDDRGKGRDDDRDRGKGGFRDRDDRGPPPRRDDDEDDSRPAWACIVATPPSSPRSKV